jgi:hypothetical protein
MPAAASIDSHGACHTQSHQALLCRRKIMAATIDEALDMLHHTSPDLVGGNSNHAPMVTETLFTLGRPEAVLPWIEGYKRRFQDHPQARNPITPGVWQAALGDNSRGADWTAFFDRALAEAPWQTVLHTWVRAPGAWTHGGRDPWAHPHRARVRSLTKLRETPQRLHELAEGLGYWAARYQGCRASHRVVTYIPPSEAMHHVSPHSRP